MIYPIVPPDSFFTWKGVFDGLFNRLHMLDGIVLAICAAILLAFTLDIIRQNKAIHGGWVIFGNLAFLFVFALGVSLLNNYILYRDVNDRLAAYFFDHSEVLPVNEVFNPAVMSSPRQSICQCDDLDGLVDCYISKNELARSLIEYRQNHLVRDINALVRKMGEEILRDQNVLQAVGAFGGIRKKGKPHTKVDLAMIDSWMKARNTIRRALISEAKKHGTMQSKAKTRIKTVLARR